MDKTTLLFPIETQSRELDFKLFLAVMLADPHTEVVIAHNGFFDHHYAKFKHSLYLGKRIFIQPAQTQQFLDELQRHDITLLFLDEEGGIYMGDTPVWESILADRVNPNALQPGDYILAWGAFQQQFYQRHNTQLPPDHICNTGHPRFDLYQPQYRSYFADDLNAIRQQYGRYVLINANLTAANNLLGIADSFSPRWGYQATDPQRRLSAVANWNHVNKTLSNLVELLHRLSAQFPAKTFIVRPHPTEDLTFYQTVFAGLDNLKVVRQGPVSAWIMGADVVIHDGCTTAIEAYLAGIPVINYKSVTNTQYDIRIPNQIGTRCETPDQVIATLQAIEHNPAAYAQQHQLTHEDFALLANLQHDHLEPFVQLLQTILSHKRDQANHSGTSHPPSWAYLKYAERLHALTQGLKSWVRPLWAEKSRQHQIYRTKFPGFEPESIRRKIALIETITQRKVQFTPISRRLLRISGVV